MKSIVTMFGIAGLALVAAPAFADAGSLETRLAQVEQQLASSSAPSAREIQSSVDAYLASARADATLVGGCGTAGYDGGFWIRGGSFLLKTNLTLQTRFEYFDWDDRSVESQPGGDLSGFSLPRVTLKLSGDATCDVHYYAELEFGHAASTRQNRLLNTSVPAMRRSRRWSRAPGRTSGSPARRGSSTRRRRRPRSGWVSSRRRRRVS